MSGWPKNVPPLPPSRPYDYELFTRWVASEEWHCDWEPFDSARMALDALAEWEREPMADVGVIRQISTGRIVYANRAALALGILPGPAPEAA